MISALLRLPLKHHVINGRPIDSFYSVFENKLFPSCKIYKTNDSCRLLSLRTFSRLNLRNVGIRIMYPFHKLCFLFRNKMVNNIQQYSIFSRPDKSLHELRTVIALAGSTIVQEFFRACI